MRDVLIFALIIGMLPYCFMRPFFGVAVWSWLGYMNPHRLTWGFAFDFPFVQLAALCTLAGIASIPMRRQPFPKMHWQREGVLLVLLCIIFFTSTVYSLRPDLAWTELTDIAKIILMALVTILLTDSEKRLRIMLMVISLSIGFFGLKGGIFSIMTGGAHRVYGPPASSIDDNTAIALGMNMILPMLYFLAKSEDHVWIRRGLYITFGLTVLAVLFTYSRGGMLGLAVVLGMIGLSLEFKKKLAIGILGIIAIPIAIQFVPEQLIDRAETITEYEQDGSAQARFGAWRTAWMIAKARPLVGGGFQIVDDLEIGRRYNPDFRPGQGGAHSIYFEIMGENGLLALAVFLALLFTAILSARKVKKQAKRAGLRDFWCYGYMLQIGIMAYAVSGAFLEFASFDLFYQMVALTIVTKVQFGKAMQARASEGSTTPLPADPQPLNA